MTVSYLHLHRISSRRGRLVSDCESTILIVDNIKIGGCTIWTFHVNFQCADRWLQFTAINNELIMGECFSQFMSTSVHSDLMDKGILENKLTSLYHFSTFFNNFNNLTTTKCNLQRTFSKSLDKSIASPDTSYSKGVEGSFLPLHLIVNLCLPGLMGTK